MRIEEIIKTSATLSEERKVVLNILYTQAVLSDRMAEVLKPYDLSGEQFNVLRILRGKKGIAANMCDIQERMITKNSNTTRLIDKLLLKEFVERNVCPENRRKIEVTITPKGLAVLAELDPKVENYEASFGKNLSNEELQNLNYLLEKFRTF